MLPDSGWVTTSIASSADAENALDLFRMGYEKAMKSARHKPTASA